MEIDLRHLRYFLMVAEELHFSRAAERLDIAQPPLSQTIKKLESALGAQLFQRTKRRVALTDAGRIFLEEARRTLAQAEHALQLVRRASRGEVGQLAVGFIGSAAYSVLPAIVRKFREQFPGINLVLHELSSIQQVQALREGRLHAGLLRLSGEETALSVKIVLREPFVVALPKAHPLSQRSKIPLRALASEPFVMFPRQFAPELYDQIMRLCHQGRFSPTVVQEAMQLPTLVSLVAAGMGVAVIPASLRNLGRTGVVYRAIREATPKAELSVAWRKDRQSPLLQSFLHVVEKEAFVEEE